MDTIAQRIKQFINYKGFSILSFEKQIGAGNNSIGTSIKRNSNLTGDLLSKILKTFPEMNAEWLLVGKGTMLKETETITHKETTALKKENEELKKELFDLNKKLRLRLEEIVDLQKNKLESTGNDKHDVLVDSPVFGKSK